MAKTMKFHKSRSNKKLKNNKSKKVKNIKNQIWGKFGSVYSPKKKQYFRLGTPKSFNIIRDELVRDGLQLTDHVFVVILRTLLEAVRRLAEQAARIGDRAVDFLEDVDGQFLRH